MNILSPSLRWAMALTLAFTAACSTDTSNDDVASSQTHWLSACDSDADCGDLSCSCGVCTRSCSDDSGCESGSSCIATSGIAACEAAAPAEVCLAECENDSDCGADGECADGVCAGAADSDTGDSSSGSDVPPGVMCGDYEACSLDTPCASGSCISLVGCDSAICISGEEACELSCPADSDCAILESYPEQIACEGRVPAIPGDTTTSDVVTEEPTASDTSDEPTSDGVTEEPTTSDTSVGTSDEPTSDVGPSEPTSMGTSDDPVTGPEGVDCDEYPACSAEDSSACSGEAWCIAAPGCPTAICISTAEWCESSCPEPDTCAIGESLPGSPSCDDVVPGTSSPLGADAGAAPPGVDCGDYPVCDPQGEGCGEGVNCIALVGCELPSCIPSAEACELSCPDPETCAIGESYPEQLFCDGRVDAHGEQEDPTMAAGFACGEAQSCDSATQYCDVFLPGMPDGTPSYSCQPAPTDCVGMVTCECLGYGADVAGPQTCSEDINGGVTVTLAAP
jgi:hypothetical protein